MRLDKYLSEMNIGTRSQVKEFIRKKQVTVNGVVVRSPDQRIDENSDAVAFRGKALKYRRFVYYMMNKPEGVVCATRDNVSQTVLDLLGEGFHPNVFPIGRLDKDTTGLLLLTNDGDLAHRLLSPAKHANKTYLAQIRMPLSAEDVSRLEQGVDIGEEKMTLPAKVTISGENPCKIWLTIQEGKFHQVKRMLLAVGNEVLALQRVSFGGLKLDEALAPGQFRELTEEELEILQQSDAEVQNEPSKRVGPPSMEGVEAVIFDLDGTLVDSMWMWRQIDIEYLGKFGIPLPEDLQNRIEGMSFQETAVYFKEHFDIPDSLEQMKNDWNSMAWDKYANEVPLKPGAAEFLQNCKKRGIHLGIATSNSRELVENIADTHGLHDYFECIMTGSDVARGKPAPDIYLAVAKGLRVSPERCLVFEDIIPGIQAGLNAGMRVCAVEDAYSADVRAEKQKLAGAYITNYDEILFLRS